VEFDIEENNVGIDQKSEGMIKECEGDSTYGRLMYERRWRLTLRRITSEMIGIPKV
jgi:hypothetical protein